MWWLTNKASKKAARPAGRHEGLPRPRHADSHEEIQRLKDEAVARAMADIEPRREELASEQVAFHQRDFDAFAFKCERVGDFMVLDITRLGYTSPSVLDHDRRDVAPVTTVQRINLSLVTNIDLVRGCAPAREEPVEVAINYYQADGATMFFEGPLRLPREGEIMDASILGHLTPIVRPAWSSSPEPLARLSHFFNVFPSLNTFPLPADDDLVLFCGLGASIHCPFGTGDEVVAEIMEAIRGS